ncbi:MAG: hypothetical protein AAF380_00740, partial [Bacteroidota bacterium]
MKKHLHILMIALLSMHQLIATDKDKPAWQHSQELRNKFLTDNSTQVDEVEFEKSQANQANRYQAGLSNDFYDNSNLDNSEQDQADNDHPTNPAQHASQTPMQSLMNNSSGLGQVYNPNKNAAANYSSQPPIQNIVYANTPNQQLQQNRSLQQPRQNINYHANPAQNHGLGQNYNINNNWSMRNLPTFFYPQQGYIMVPIPNNPNVLQGYNPSAATNYNSTPQTNMGYHSQATKSMSTLSYRSNQNSILPQYDTVSNASDFRPSETQSVKSSDSKKKKKKEKKKKDKKSAKGASSSGLTSPYHPSTFAHQQSTHNYNALSTAQTAPSLQNLHAGHSLKKTIENNDVQQEKTSCYHFCIACSHAKKSFNFTSVNDIDRIPYTCGFCQKPSIIGFSNSVDKSSVEENSQELHNIYSSFTTKIPSLNGPSVSVIRQAISSHNQRNHNMIENMYKKNNSKKDILQLGNVFITRNYQYCTKKDMSEAKQRQSMHQQNQMQVPHATYSASPVATQSHTGHVAQPTTSPSHLHPTNNFLGIQSLMTHKNSMPVHHHTSGHTSLFQNLTQQQNKPNLMQCDNNSCVNSSNNKGNPLGHVWDGTESKICSTCKQPGIAYDKSKWVKPADESTILQKLQNLPTGPNPSPSSHKAPSGQMMTTCINPSCPHKYQSLSNHSSSICASCNKPTIVKVPSNNSLTCIADIENMCKNYLESQYSSCVSIVFERNRNHLKMKKYPLGDSLYHINIHLKKNFTQNLPQSHQSKHGAPAGFIATPPQATSSIPKLSLVEIPSVKSSGSKKKTKKKGKKKKEKKSAKAHSIAGLTSSPSTFAHQQSTHNYNAPSTVQTAPSLQNLTTGQNQSVSKKNNKPEKVLFCCVNNCLNNNGNRIFLDFPASRPHSCSICHENSVIQINMDFYSAHVQKNNFFLKKSIYAKYKNLVNNLT